MKKKDEYTFIQFPIFFYGFLFFTLLTTGVYIIFLISSIKNYNANDLTLIVSVSIFFIVALILLLCLFFLLGLKIVKIDNQKIILKNLIKIKSSILIEDIDKILLKILRRQGYYFFILNKNAKKISTRKYKKNSYISFFKTKKREAIIKQFWNGKIEITDEFD